MYICKKCTQYFYRKYYPYIYLTNDEWLNVFLNKTTFINKIKNLSLSIDDCFFISINYSARRFRQILELLLKNNIFYNFDVFSHTIDVAKLVFNLMKKEPDNLNLTYLNKHLYLMNYDNSQSQIAYLEYCLSFLKKNKDFVISESDLNLYSVDLRINKKNKLAYKLLCQLYMHYIRNNVITSSSLSYFTENLLVVKDKIKVDKIIINNIFNFLKKYCLPYLYKHNYKYLYYGITTIKKIYNLLNFSLAQKNVLASYINGIDSYLFLARL